MNKIMKSYLKTFFKNWLSTLFMIIFIVTLAASVIGMLATPLQIYTKMQSAQRQNVKYDSIFSSSKKDLEYSQDFVLSYSKNYLDEAFVQYIDSLIYSNSSSYETVDGKIDWNDLNADLKNKLTNTINYEISEYRNGANTKVIEINTTLKDKFPKLSPKQVFLYHVEKSIKLGLYEFEEYLATDDSTPITSKIMSIAASTIYKVINFAQSNGLEMVIPSPMPEINDIESLKKFIISIYEKSLEKWNPITIKVSSYVMYNDEYSRLLSKNEYQHDERLLLFDQVINQNKASDYSINVNKNFVFKSSSANPLAKTQTFEVKTISEQAFNNLIFDNKYKNSVKSKEWKNNEVPEVVISSAFAHKNNLKLGDEIQIPISKSSNILITKLFESSNLFPSESFFNQDSFKVKVAGVGQIFDDFVPGSNFSGFSQTMKNYGFIYFNQKFINKFREYSWNFLTTEASYNLELKIKNNNGVTGKPYNLFTIKGEEKDVKIFSNLETSLISWSGTNISDSLDNLKIRIIINIVLGSIILALSFLFINFQLKKEMNETRKQLGIFKSFGYTTKELSWIFSVKTGILFLVSLIIGYFISIPIQLFAVQAFENTVTINFNSIYASSLFLFSLFIIVPSLFLLISYLTTILYIKEPVLSLMSNARRTKVRVRKKLIFKKIFSGQRFFTWRLRRSFVKTSKGKFYTVQILFACASFTYILLFGAQTLMTKVLNQTFSVYNEKIDHMYQWSKSNPELDIKSNSNKYEYKYLDDQTSAQYKDYSGYKNTNEYLLEKEFENDYRYRIDTVIQMTNNYFISLNKNDKVNFLLPKSEMFFTLNKMLGVKTVDLTPENESISSFISTIMSYNLLSIDANYTKALNDVKTTGKTSEKLEPLSKAKRITDFTLSNMTSDKVKNMFAKDMSYIYAVKLAQINLTISVLPEIIGKPNEIIKFEDFANLKTNDAWINNAYKKLDNDELINKVNIFDIKQRNLNDNWLLTQIGEIFEPIIQQQLSLLISANFSSISTTASNIFNTVQLMDFANYDELDYMMNINTIMYDKENEVLFDTVSLTQPGEYDNLEVSARLVNTDTNEFGNFQEAFNFEEVSTDQMNRFKNSAQENAGTDIMNAILPYSISRNKGYKINDIIEFETYTSNPRPVKIRVVGINKAESVKLAVDTIWINNKEFKDKYYSDQLKDKVFYSNLYSKNKMLYLNTKTNDLFKIFTTLKVLEKNFSIIIDEDKPIMLDILRLIFSFTNTSNQTIETNLKMSINPYFIGLSREGLSLSFIVNNFVINKVTKIVNEIMLIFVLLTTLLLAIILVVIIGIIVEEAKIIILTLQALGYKDKEINWIVMGSYVMGTVISFVFAYVFSVIFWKVLLAWVANKFSVYIFMSVDLKTILITLAVMTIVLLFGWYASNKQVKRNPLTQITSLA
ncbi:ABC transporter permease [Mesoplasma melaleucae]|uniref:ABC transporter permease n=1 Tax=Mesoplasma melaleucae TaxID=81459 RepID=A0A2K8NX20_9MOLU|nr:ABC transporter permease [Mesoplasma melaleucae]ATZ18086.1 ABC transporter permease [Mesoplasma melaleucae]